MPLERPFELLGLKADCKASDVAEGKGHLGKMVYPLVNQQIAVENHMFFQWENSLCLCPCSSVGVKLPESMNNIGLWRKASGND